MKIIFIIVILLSILYSSQAIFSYKVETRQFNRKVEGYTNEHFAYELQNAVNNAPQPYGYCTKYNVHFPLSNGKLCGSSSNIFWKIELLFQETHGDHWHFELGTDFGEGAAIFIDGVLHKVYRTDLWWAHNWKSTDVIKFDKQLSGGAHTITIYGGERCCDGAMDIRYKKGYDAKWKYFTSKNLNLDTKDTLHKATVSTKQLPIFHKNNDKQFGVKLRNEYDTAQQPKGYCKITNPEWPISNSKNCHGPSTNILFRYDIQFKLQQALNLEFELGVDFGLGYAVYVNGKLYRSSRDDHWYGGNFNNKQEIISIKKLFYEGKHTILIFGSEKCCDGPSVARFRTKGGSFLNLTKTNWKKVTLSSYLDVEVETKKRFDQNYESLDIVPENFRHLYPAYPQPRGFCDVKNVEYPIQNTRNCLYGSPKNILWKAAISFYETYNSYYQFKIGADFGQGIVVYVNGEQKALKDEAICWAQNFLDLTEVTVVGFKSHAYSINYIEIYGAQQYGDGILDILFKKDDYDWKHINKFGESLSKFESYDYKYYD